MPTLEEVGGESKITKAGKAPPGAPWEKALAGMRPGTIEVVKNLARWEMFQCGEVIHEYGQPVRSVFILNSGAVDILMPKTNRLLYTVRDPGALLGWSSMVGRTTSSATLRCHEEAVLLRLDKKKLNDIFRRNSACGMVFYRKLSEEIGQRLTNAYQVISLLLGEIS